MVMGVVAEGMTAAEITADLPQLTDDHIREALQFAADAVDQATIPLPATARARTRRIVVTADTDFGTLLALTGAAGPSVILLRRTGHRTSERARIVLTVLALVELPIQL